MARSDIQRPSEPKFDDLPYSDKTVHQALSPMIFRYGIAYE
jgi:hypothetical protein